MNFDDPQADGSGCQAPCSLAKERPQVLQLIPSKHGYHGYIMDDMDDYMDSQW